jgi:tRNA A-37 threonylcarbamoyl transferase component Bud32
MADLAPGQVLGGRFEIVGVLGRGGTASVWLAFDRVRGERIALKVLHDHLATHASMRSRLQREVQAAGRLRHPSALVAFELHEIDGRLALSMPLHSGRTLLHHVQASGPMTAAKLEKLARALLGALAEAHRHGVIHRDVTPMNVLVDATGEGMLTDFGLAAVGEVRSATATSALGTSGYAAPEVYQGVRTDPRSDLYGLGATLYFAATGHGPFESPNPVGTLQKQLAEDRISLTEARADLPLWLSETIDALFARDPDARPGGARDAVARLDSRLTPAPKPRKIRVSARAVGLPAGEYAVLVRERRFDANRRRAARRALRRRTRGDLGATVQELVERTNRGLRGLLGLPVGPEPEEHLADAVSEAAGLPAGALVLVEELFQREFRLVDKVAASTADDLARAARNAGFQAESVKGRSATIWWSRLVSSAILFVVAFTFLGVSTRLQLPDAALFLTTPIAVMPFVVALVFAFRALVQGIGSRGYLPVAYPDVKGALRPELALELAEAVKSLPPWPVAEPVGARPRSLADGALADLEALAAAIEQEAPRLPEPAHRDLRDTVRDLLARGGDLATAIRRREDLLRRTDGSLDLTIQRLEDRVERLQTLERAGDAVDRAELSRLQANLAAQRAEADSRAEEEGHLARQLGEMLEIGATASRARRALLDQLDPLESAQRLRAQLRAESEAATAALDETAPPRREAAIRQRQAARERG